MSDSPILHVESFGRLDSPCIVFLHGLAGSAASWGAPFRQIANSHRVLLVDVLGFGRSPKPAIGYTLQDHIAALHATLLLHNAEQAHVVGHSMGALLALAFAAHQPTHVEGLTLLAMPWYSSEAEARTKIAEQSLFNRWLALETPLARIACSAMCHLRPWLMPLMPRLVRDVPSEVAKDVLRHNWLSYSRSLKHLIIELRPAELLPLVNVPLLFIQGLKDKTAPPAPVASGIEGYANAQLQTIDAGHYMIFTHAQSLANGIRDLLNQ